MVAPEPGSEAQVALWRFPTRQSRRVHCAADTPPPATADLGGLTIPPPPGAFAAGSLMPANDAPATIYIRVDGDNLLLGAILARLVSAGIPVYGYEEALDDLEEIFLRTTKGLVQ